MSPGRRWGEAEKWTCFCRKPQSAWTCNHPGAFTNYFLPGTFGRRGFGAEVAPAFTDLQSSRWSTVREPLIPEPLASDTPLSNLWAFQPLICNSGRMNLVSFLSTKWVSAHLTCCTALTVHPAKRSFSKFSPSFSDVPGAVLHSGDFAEN